MKDLKERVLPDDYPVYAGYIYVLDGVPRNSWVQGAVRDLRRDTGATEVKSCDLVGRELM